MTHRRKEYYENLREEYRQINLWLRHLEITWWGIAAVIFPLTAGTIYFSITNEIQNSLNIILFIIIAIIWTGYIFYTKYVLMKAYKWGVRIKDIEKGLNITFATKYGEPTKDDIENFLNDYFPKDRLQRCLYKHLPFGIRFDKVMVVIWVIIIAFVLLICIHPIFKEEMHNEKEKCKTEFHQWNFRSK